MFFLLYIPFFLLYIPEERMVAAQRNVYYFTPMTVGAGCHGDAVPLSEQVLPFHAQHPNVPLISNVGL